MPLARAVQGARHTAQRISWRDKDGDPQDLTGATITGRIENRKTNTAVAIDGTLLADGDPEDGVFVWSYGANDVATAGVFDVQFIATYGPLNDKTLVETWTVERAI
mgnify:CR=1 FL=1